MGDPVDLLVVEIPPSRRRVIGVLGIALVQTGNAALAELLESGWSITVLAADTGAVVQEVVATDCADRSRLLDDICAQHDVRSGVEVLVRRRGPWTRRTNRPLIVSDDA